MVKGTTGDRYRRLTGNEAAEADGDHSQSPTCLTIVINL
jgi:hypothetical protein